MTVDAARLGTLMGAVENWMDEMPKLYGAGGAPLATEQQVLQLLRKAAGALAEACVIAADDPATFASLDALRARTVERLIESARTCMRLEEAALMREAAGQTLH